MANFTEDILKHILTFVQPTNARNTSTAFGIKSFNWNDAITQIYPPLLPQQKNQTKKQIQAIQPKILTPTEIIKQQDILPFVIKEILGSFDEESTKFIYKLRTYNRFDMLCIISEGFIRVYFQDQEDKTKLFKLVMLRKRLALYFTSFVRYGTTDVPTEQMMYLARRCIDEVVYQMPPNVRPIRPTEMGEIKIDQSQYVEINRYIDNSIRQVELTIIPSPPFNSNFYLRFEHNNTKYQYRMTVSFTDNSISQHINAYDNDVITLDISDYMISCTINKKKKISYNCLVKKIERYRNIAISTFQKLLENNSYEKYKEMLKWTNDLMVRFFNYDPAKTTYDGKTYALSDKIPSPSMLLNDTFKKFNSQTHVNIRFDDE